MVRLKKPIDSMTLPSMVRRHHHKVKGSEFVRESKDLKQLKKDRIEFAENYFSMRLLNHDRLKKSITPQQFKAVESILSMSRNSSVRTGQNSFFPTPVPTVVKSKSSSYSISSFDYKSTLILNTPSSYKQLVKSAFPTPEFSVDTYTEPSYSTKASTKSSYDETQAKKGLWITQDMIKNCTFGKKQKAAVELDLSNDEVDDFSKVAREFLSWVDSTDFGKQKFDEAGLKQLFTVGFDDFTRQSLLLQHKELKCLSKNISTIFNDPDQSIRAAIHRQILWDIYYENKMKDSSKKKKKNKNKKDTYAEWFETSIVPEEIFDFSFFWKDMLEENIINDFATWLISHPEEYKPKYLEKVGLFDKIEKELKGKMPLSLKSLNERFSDLLAPDKRDRSNFEFLAYMEETYGHISTLTEDGYVELC